MFVFSDAIEKEDQHAATDEKTKLEEAQRAGHKEEMSKLSLNSKQTTNRNANKATE